MKLKTLYQWLFLIHVLYLNDRYKITLIYTCLYQKPFGWPEINFSSLWEVIWFDCLFSCFGFILFLVFSLHLQVILFSSCLFLFEALWLFHCLLNTWVSVIITVFSYIILIYSWLQISYNWSNETFYFSPTVPNNFNFYFIAGSLLVFCFIYYFKSLLGLVYLFIIFSRSFVSLSTVLVVWAYWQLIWHHVLEAKGNSLVKKLSISRCCRKKKL